MRAGGGGQRSPILANRWGHKTVTLTTLLTMPCATGVTNVVFDSFSGGAGGHPVSRFMCMQLRYICK